MIIHRHVQPVQSSTSVYKLQAAQRFEHILANFELSSGLFLQSRRGQRSEAVTALS